MARVTCGVPAHQTRGWLGCRSCGRCRAWAAEPALAPGRSIRWGACETRRTQSRRPRAAGGVPVAVPLNRDTQDRERCGGVPRAKQVTLAPEAAGEGCLIQVW